MTDSSRQPAPGHADAYRGKRVCVTGGAGFIGAHLAEALIARGASVVIIDDLSTGDADRVASLIDARPESVRFVHASILEPGALDDAFERAHAVFHLAAVASASRSLAEPERTIDVNVRGTVEVCQAARAAGVRRVVLASSASVYGDAPSLPSREDAPLAPSTPYAASKRSAELMLETWSRAFQLSGVSLRLFNVYGPRTRAGAEDESDVKDGAPVVDAFFSRLRDGKAPEIYGDGMQTRDFVHVCDAARAFLLAGAGERATRGEAINIGSGTDVDLLTLARMCARAAGVEPRKPEHLHARPGDPRRSRADTTRARELLGFGCEIGLESGLDALARRARGEPDAAPAACLDR